MMMVNDDDYYRMNNAVFGSTHEHHKLSRADMESDMYVHIMRPRSIYIILCVSYTKQKILANMLKARLVISSLLFEKTHEILCFFFALPWFVHSTWNFYFCSSDSATSASSSSSFSGHFYGSPHHRPRRL